MSHKRLGEIEGILAYLVLHRATKSRTLHPWGCRSCRTVMPALSKFGRKEGPFHSKHAIKKTKEVGTHLWKIRALADRRMTLTWTACGEPVLLLLCVRLPGSPSSTCVALCPPPWVTEPRNVVKGH